jgi:hypothetical protein
VLEFIGFLAIFFYFVYNVVQMPLLKPEGFLEGLKIFFLQGAIDFIGMFKR